MNNVIPMAHPLRSGAHQLSVRAGATQTDGKLPMAQRIIIMLGLGVVSWAAVIALVAEIAR